MKKLISFLLCLCLFLVKLCSLSRNNSVLLFSVKNYSSYKADTLCKKENKERNEDTAYVSGNGAEECKKVSAKGDLELIFTKNMTAFPHIKLTCSIY